MALAQAGMFFLFAVFSHAVLTRLPLRSSAVGKFFVVGGLFGLLLMGWQIITQAPGLAFAAAVLAYAFACELYLFLFTMVTTSISANLLRILLQRNLDERELQNIYAPGKMVELRFERLVKTGLLEQHHSQFRLTEKGSRLLKLFRFLRRLFHHAPPPEYRAVA